MCPSRRLGRRLDERALLPGDSIHYRGEWYIVVLGRMPPPHSGCVLAYRFCSRGGNNHWSQKPYILKKEDVVSAAPAWGRRQSSSTAGEPVEST